MTYETQKEVLSVEEAQRKLSVPDEVAQQIKEHRETIKNILDGEDNRKIVVVGPCAAWPDEAVIDYAEKLSQLSEYVSDKLFLVMRVYTQKPRTTTGWTGALNQPNPRGEPDIEAGIHYCRKMMLDVASKGVPIADEALFMHKVRYLNDLLSYVAIGARSTEDQEHRIYASMIEAPVAMKNPTSGDVVKAVQSVVAAQHSHVFLWGNKQVQTSGNPYAHVMLRGGEGQPNYDRRSIHRVIRAARKHDVKPRVLVDASHENSRDQETGDKDPYKQGDTVMEVVESMRRDDDIKQVVKGFMVESFLEHGNQRPGDEGDLVPGKSIVDPCLSWNETTALIQGLYEALPDAPEQ